MKRLIFIVMFLFSANLYAASLKPADAELLEAAGVPIYPGAVFAIGSKDAGFRFATSAPVEEVRNWYRKQLAEWSLLDKYASWILYKGKPDLDMGGIMATNQVSVRTNDKIPAWHGLEKNMTTEISIMIIK